MLSLVHLELVVRTQLLIQLTVDGVGLGRLDLLLHLVQSVVNLGKVIIEQTPSGLLLLGLSSQLLELSLDDFRYLELENVGESYELGGKGLVYLGLQRLLTRELFLTVTAAAAVCSSLVRILFPICLSLRGRRHGIRLFGLPLVLLQSLELLCEDLDLSHELDLVVPQLDELVHHAVALLLALLAALTRALTVLQLPKGEIDVSLFCKPINQNNNTLLVLAE